MSRGITGLASTLSSKSCARAIGESMGQPRLCLLCCELAALRRCLRPRARFHFSSKLRRKRTKQYYSTCLPPRECSCSTQVETRRACVVPQSKQRHVVISCKQRGISQNSVLNIATTQQPHTANMDNGDGGPEQGLDLSQSSDYGTTSGFYGKSLVLLHPSSHHHHHHLHQRPPGLACWPSPCPYKAWHPKPALHATALELRVAGWRSWCGGSTNSGSTNSPSNPQHKPS